MTNLLRTAALIFLFGATLTLLATAQTTKDGVITINGGRNAVYTKAPEYITSSYPELSQLTIIYNTLGPANNRYNGLSGVGILGVNAGQPYPERVANGFTPTADHTVTAIAVSAAY